MDFGLFSSAFTLVELMVVITIIVVLLALLTPALDRAIYQAEFVVCAARKHVVAVGTQMYLHDNKRVFFTSAERPDHARRLESGYVYDYNADTDGEWYDLVRPYVTPGHGPKPPRVQYSDAFFCATIQQTRSYARNPAFHRLMADMAINAFLTGYRPDTVGGGAFRNGPIRAGSVENPARVLLYMESMRGGNPAWNMPDYFFVLTQPIYEAVLEAHEGQSNMTFVDGHVQRCDPRDVGYESATPALLDYARTKPYQLMQRPDTNQDGK